MEPQAWPEVCVWLRMHRFVLKGKRQLYKSEKAFLAARSCMSGLVLGYPPGGLDPIAMFPEVWSIVEQR